MIDWLIDLSRIFLEDDVEDEIYGSNDFMTGVDMEGRKDSILRDY